MKTIVLFVLYESALNKIKSNNNFFKVSTKIVAAVGNDANVQVLQEITGNKEAVIKVNDEESTKSFMEIIRKAMKIYF